MLYRRAVREFGRPDVLHAHFTDYAYLAAELKKQEHVPLVVTEHSSLVNQDTLPSDIKQAAKTAFQQADCLIAVSPALAQKMEEHSHRKVLWVPDMVDTELFSYSDEHERQKALREEVEMEEEGGEFSFLSCGNLRKIKRMDVLIKAFAKAFRDCPKVTLTICGQGEEEASLHKLITDLKHGWAHRGCWDFVQGRKSPIACSSVTALLWHRYPKHLVLRTWKRCPAESLSLRPAAADRSAL